MIVNDFFGLANLLGKCKFPKLEKEKLFRIIDKKIDINERIEGYQKKLESMQKETKPEGLDESDTEAMNKWQAEYQPLVAEFIRKEDEMDTKCMDKDTFAEFCSFNNDTISVEEIVLLKKCLVD